LAKVERTNKVRKKPVRSFDHWNNIVLQSKLELFIYLQRE